MDVIDSVPDRRTGVDKGSPGGPRPPNDDISVTDMLEISKITWNYLHLFYKISKNLKAFTVSHASNDPQQLSLAKASLQLNPVVHVTITQREGGICIRCPICILV